MARSRLVPGFLFVACSAPLLYFLLFHASNAATSSLRPFRHNNLSLPSSRTNILLQQQTSRGFSPAVDSQAEQWVRFTWNTEGGGSPPFLVFVHVPKTAGSSVKHLLHHICGRKGAVVDHHSSFRFLSYSERKQNSYCSLYGHIGYGIDEMNEWKVHKQVMYITFLRDPVRRLLSQYNFSCRRMGDSANMTLDEFLDKKERQWSFGPWSGIDPATSQLGTPRFWTSIQEQFAMSPVSREDLQRAKWRLAHGVDVLGLVERYEDSIRLMSFKLGLKLPKQLVNQQNNQSKRPTDLHLSQLSDAQLRRMREMNRLDIELYEYAQQLFEARLAAMNRRNNG
ncbi:Sulfotransferase family protein [Balamuthia mandrillaris]